MNSKGFTLIELLIVVAIVGILATIGISAFSTYKAKSFDSQAVSDLKAGMIAEEAYYAENQTYVTCTDADDCEGSLPNFRATRESDGSSGMSDFSFTATDQTYVAIASHVGGRKDFNYDSASGELSSSDK